MKYEQNRSYIGGRVVYVLKARHLDQHDSSWMFGLKMELMACYDLVGGTTEKSCIFPDVIWQYQWYETIPSCMHYTSAVPQPFLLLIAANLALAQCLGSKWSLWPVPNWLVVQRSKAVLFLIFYYIINGMKHFWTVWFTLDSCLCHFCCWFLPIWP